MDGAAFHFEPLACVACKSAVFHSPSRTRANEEVRSQDQPWAIPDAPVLSSITRLPSVKTQSFVFPRASKVFDARLRPVDAASSATGYLGEPTLDAAPRTTGRSLEGASLSTDEDVPLQETPPLLSWQNPRAVYTRVAPPRDIVKLEDRLRYMLQPSLEVVLSAETLALQHHPFPYQLDGVAFLYPRASAVLADEMGLGKTMQAAIAIRLLLHAGEIRRALIVCPKPLVSNWQKELETWAPELPRCVVVGDRSTRKWQWENASDVVLIANYEAVQRDQSLLQESRHHFDLVVLDESQRIKNLHGSTAKAIRAIPRTRAWALTGTPVENRPQDLRSIFEFVSPGLLTPEMKPRELGLAAQDFVLRRTKAEVMKDLPPRLEDEAVVSLTPAQRMSYQLAEKEGVLRLSQMGDTVTIQHLFELVLRLKQICNFDPATGESSKADLLRNRLTTAMAGQGKAIVFSQWVGTLLKLKAWLADFHPLEYHGQISPEYREQVIEDFRHSDKSRVLLMSYGAGSVGLNLQFCSHVYLFDRWWNPAVEDQAVNRAHRIGSTGPVTVTRFLTAETIEERIEAVLAKKRELFDSIFSDLEQPARLGLSREEVFGLFRLNASPSRARGAA